MFLGIVLTIFIFNGKVLTQDLYGSECNPPIKCVNSTSFAFCTIIGGEEKLVGYENCLEGQKCSTTANFQPCINDPTPSVDDSSSPPTRTTSTTKTPTVLPPNCDETGSGNYPAPKCYQYYTCSKTLWWWDAKLKTCPKTKAFDEKLKECVPSEQTSCKLVA